MQRARDGCSRQREHIRLQLHLLQALFVLHAKAMLFVHHNQTEVGELDVRAEQPVGPDHDIDLLLFELLHHDRLLFGRLKAAHHFDGDREVGEPIPKAARVLFRQNGGRHQHGHLTTALHRLEGGTNRDLGFSVAHVAHQQTIHRPFALQVALDVERRLALVGRVLKQKRAFQLTLPRPVDFVRRSRADFAFRVQVKQFLGHLQDGHARLVALRLPPIAPQLVQARRGGVLRHIVRTAVALDLIDLVQGHVQSIAPLVLDHHRFNRALTKEDLFNPAIDAYPVLQVHDIVTGLEGPQRVERRPGDVFARATQPAIATKDLMIRQDADDVRHHEPAAQHADRNRRRHRPVFAEQFFQTLCLPRVVAQNDRVQPIALQPTQHAKIARDPFRRAYRERHIGRRPCGLHIGTRRADRALRWRRNANGAKTRQPRGHDRRLDEERFARDVSFPAPTCQFDMMRRLVPRAHQLRKDRASRRDDHERVGGPEFGQRHALDGPVTLLHAAVDGQNERELRVTRAALRVEVKVSQLCNLIAPKLETHRFGHTERVDVEDATAHRELRDVFHHRDALESNGFEMCGQLFGPADIALAKLQPCIGQGARQLRLFEHGTRRRDQQPHPAARQLLERFDTLAGHFGVRFYLAEAFARRVEGHRNVVHQRLQVCQPPFRVAYLIGNHHEQALRFGACQGGDEDRVTASGKTAHAQRHAGTRKRLRYPRKRRQRNKGIKKSWKTH